MRLSARKRAQRRVDGTNLRSDRVTFPGWNGLLPVRCACANLLWCRQLRWFQLQCRLFKLQLLGATIQRAGNDKIYVHGQLVEKRRLYDTTPLWVRLQYHNALESSSLACLDTPSRRQFACTFFRYWGGWWCCGAVDKRHDKQLIPSLGLCTRSWQGGMNNHWHKFRTHEWSSALYMHTKKSFTGDISMSSSLGAAKRRQIKGLSPNSWANREG